MYTNPFTRHYYAGNSFRRDANARLPVARSMLETNETNKLVVPNQDVPLGDRSYAFNVNGDMITCPDGTVIDIKKKIIYKSKREQVKLIKQPGDSRYSEWSDNRNINIDDIVNQKLHGEIDRTSQKYWKYADEQTQHLLDELPDDLKDVIKQFELEHPTKFEDEDA